MRTDRPFSTRTACAVTALVIGFGVAATPLPAQEPMTSWGRMGKFMGEPSGAGNWMGTWYYQNRDLRFALWMRPGKDGRPEAKLHFQSLASPETFETDWSGKASYFLEGQPVEFEMRIESGDAVEARGSWHWTVEFPDSGRTETGRFHLYRILNGRQAVLDFDEYEKTVRRQTRAQKSALAPGYAFTKVSKRHVLWDEIPW